MKNLENILFIIGISIMFICVGSCIYACYDASKVTDEYVRVMTTAHEYDMKSHYTYKVYEKYDESTSSTHIIYELIN